MKPSYIMKHLTTPITDEDLASVNVGDQISISGTIYTGRDAALPQLVRLIEENNAPFDFTWFFLNNGQIARQFKIFFYLGHQLIKSRIIEFLNLLLEHPTPIRSFGGRVLPHARCLRRRDTVGQERGHNRSCQAAQGGIAR